MYIYNIVYMYIIIYIHIHTLGGSRHDETWWRRLSNLPLQSNVHCSILFVKVYIWLVVSTLLKNISQLGWLFPTYGKMKNVPNHQPDHSSSYFSLWSLKPVSVKGLLSEMLSTSSKRTGCRPESRATLEHGDITGGFAEWDHKRWNMLQCEAPVR